MNNPQPSTGKPTEKTLTSTAAPAHPESPDAGINPNISAGVNKTVTPPKAISADEGNEVDDKSIGGSKIQNTDQTGDKTTKKPEIVATSNQINDPPSNTLNTTKATNATLAENKETPSANAAENQPEVKVKTTVPTVNKIVTTPNPVEIDKPHDDKTETDETPDSGKVDEGNDQLNTTTSSTTLSTVSMSTSADLDEDFDKSEGLDIDGGEDAVNADNKPIIEDNKTTKPGKMIKKKICRNHVHVKGTRFVCHQSRYI